MAIEFHCGGCNSLLRTSDDKAGRRAKCPHCGATVTTPSPAGTAVLDEYEGSEQPDVFSQYFGGEPTHVKPRREPAYDYLDSRVPCPMCGELLAATARRCRHCGETVGGPPAPHAGNYVPTAGSSVASMVLGIIGLLTFCLWFVGPPCSLLGVGLGIFGIRAARSGEYQGEGMAVAGLVLGILGLTFSAIMYGFLFAAFKGQF